MIRRALRLLWRVTVCLTSFFAVLFAGFMFHEQFSWAGLGAEASDLWQTLRFSDPLKILAGPVPILIYWVACVIAGETIGRWLDRRRVG